MKTSSRNGAATFSKQPPLPDKRADLLRAVLDFVRDARSLPGVRRIALIGSLTTPKAIPKDVDLLVEVADDLQNVRLDPPLIAGPPLELWSDIITRAEIPDDVREELVAALR